MMRELIRQKPFEAKRGATLEVWDNVAAALSTALQQKVKVKQIRDRLNLLKARLKANEQAPFSASGVEESLDAVSIQSHYSDVDGKRVLLLKVAVVELSVMSDSDLSNSRDAESTVSATESAASVGSTKSTTQRTPKRSNAFLTEVKRQEKRYKEKMGLKVRELEQDQKQFEERLSFEKKTSETQF
ncbi:hypothetical protein PC116_g9731 [Phytophthora cactorum]|uniref:Uncharacterized protein n=1 Tax=Phytophthora cactorum TaxID=29920 RepID=A0A8T1EAJ0_9STRA|nr:hypothetical protein PC117_g4642 [Phytophthora cactorum]KAG4242376.1 hypothetical protein PC116_g9731 [Phytophthora cactorum]